MIKKISIKNYKSIVDDEIELGRVNVFIGENGAGKSNILEAVGMFSAVRSYDGKIEGLINKGVRVTKPDLMRSCFPNGKKQDKSNINFEVVTDFGEQQIIKLEPTQISEEIYSEWKDYMPVRNFRHDMDNLPEDETRGEVLFEKVIENLFLNRPFAPEKPSKFPRDLLKEPKFKEIYDNLLELKGDQKEELYIAEYHIYSPTTLALRGITNNSNCYPLGIYGEGLDTLLSTFDEEEWQLLRDYSHFISWLDDVFVDEGDRLKFEGHKLGRSTSTLYFVDQFMRKNNNIFAAENANEGALYVLFYLALFISKKTPSFFAIDNIETALNPKICRELMTSIAALAEKTDKQVLVTTHNPAILDGINLNDDEQRLFVVSRTDEGHTKTKRIKFKPQNGQSKYKLSELWMRGKLGGLPQNFL